jgi:four helix bundle protein
MKQENVIQTKSYEFAKKVVNLYRYLVEEKREYVLSKQLLRSGTSIGANVEEGIGGQSPKDFFAKLNIAYKEARESHYWLRLLKDTGYLEIDKATEYLNDCDELLRIMGSIIKTMKVKLGLAIPNS